MRPHSISSLFLIFFLPKIPKKQLSVQFGCCLFKNVLSCFCRYLISQGANVGVVNSEGETPLDIAEEEAMEELLQNEINRQGTAASP